MASYFHSPIKQKIVLLLAAGITLGLSPSPRTHYRILKSVPKAFKAIERNTLKRIINELGKKHALRYNPENISISIPTCWDKKCRIIVFDIPEKKRKARDALRFEIKKLGFFELQKSVWIYPFDCRNAIDFLVEFFEVRRYVRYLVVSEMTYDADLKLRFGL